MARRGHFEHLTQSCVLLLYCIVGPYVCILYYDVSVKCWIR